MQKGVAPPKINNTLCRVFREMARHFGPICAGEMHLWGNSFLCDALQSSAVTGTGLANVCGGYEASWGLWYTRDLGGCGWLTAREQGGRLGKKVPLHYFSQGASLEPLEPAGLGATSFADLAAELRHLAASAMYQYPATWSDLSGMHWQPVGIP